jgi:hypothetical protein
MYGRHHSGRVDAATIGGDIRFVVIRSRQTKGNSVTVAASAISAIDGDPTPISEQMDRPNDGLAVEDQFTLEIAQARPCIAS